MNGQSEASEAAADFAEMASLLGVDPSVLIGGLNLVKAANVLGIAASTLRQRALSGQIGYERDGRRWIFSWRHITEYKQRREHAPTRSTPSGGILPRLIGTASGRRRDAETIEAEARALGLL